jgi:hypothetical protein
MYKSIKDPHHLTFGYLMLLQSNLQSYRHMTQFYTLDLYYVLSCTCS